MVIRNFRKKALIAGLFFVLTGSLIVGAAWQPEVVMR